MKWEFIGEQEMQTPPSGIFNARQTLKFMLWRAKVPGGWLLNARAPYVATDHNLTFLPDPLHQWTGDEAMDDSASILLRPSGLDETPQIAGQSGAPRITDDE